ncbi:MAG TPA: hypothetical protein PK745_13310 [bacterium]|nr:hypothetical protein [bacterium]
MNKAYHTAIWFGTARPEPEKFEAILNKGYCLRIADDAIALASSSPDGWKSAKEQITALIELAEIHGASNIFGEFPVHFSIQFQKAAQDAVQEGKWGDCIACFSEFENEWQVVGYLSKKALRWTVFVAA